MVFGISECAEARKVKFAAAILQGRALTWWNSQVATMGLEAANQIGWTKMKRIMTDEFFPVEEVQQMEHELWNLKVKEFDITAYTKRFHELQLGQQKGQLLDPNPLPNVSCCGWHIHWMEQKLKLRIKGLPRAIKEMESSQGG
ncbi:putative reverse transcriptase domain-containing protein [Tanacetum coccineum]|uniref:Reverse transcriptase domain-containing protein n=1 Tax=Tanacetum coccineum TaxID=301880 RepID=A0ABQ5EJ44_9ASTR